MCNYKCWTLLCLLLISVLVLTGLLVQISSDSYSSHLWKQWQDPDADTVNRTDEVIFFKIDKWQDSGAAEGQNQGCRPTQENKWFKEVAKIKVQSYKYTGGALRILNTGKGYKILEQIDRVREKHRLKYNKVREVLGTGERYEGNNPKTWSSMTKPSK